MLKGCRYCVCQECTEAGESDQQDITENKRLYLAAIENKRKGQTSAEREIANSIVILLWTRLWVSSPNLIVITDASTHPPYVLGGQILRFIRIWVLCTFMWLNQSLGLMFGEMYYHQAPRIWEGKQHTATNQKFFIDTTRPGFVRKLYRRVPWATGFSILEIRERSQSLCLTSSWTIIISCILPFDMYRTAPPQKFLDHNVRHIKSALGDTN